MKKRLIALALALVMIFTMIPYVFADDVCENISGSSEVGTSVTFTATASKKILGRRLTFTQTKGTYYTEDDNYYEAFAPYSITLTTEGKDGETKTETKDFNGESIWFWLDRGKTYTITVTAVEYSTWQKFIQSLPHNCDGMLCQPVFSYWVTPSTWTVEARSGISLCEKVS